MFTSLDIAKAVTPWRALERKRNKCTLFACYALDLQYNIMCVCELHLPVLIVPTEQLQNKVLILTVGLHRGTVVVAAAACAAVVIAVHQSHRLERYL